MPLAGRWPAHWFPRSAALEAADSAGFSIRLGAESVKEQPIESGRRAVASVRSPGRMMMSTRVVVLVALVATLGVGGVALLAQTTRPGDTLQLWEYRTEIAWDRAVPAEARGDARRGVATAADGMLNTRGREGWERGQISFFPFRAPPMSRS